MLKIIRHSPSAIRSSPLRVSHLPAILLVFLILTYTAYFSWYTINRHNTLHSYAADLSLIDQPMWNTFHGGGFMELTWGDHQQPRLAEHFESILIPLSLLFYLWDDVRVLLIAQTLALALGALPVYWIARKQLSMVNGELLIINNSQFTIHNLAALAFAAAYLLFPPLQAANIADFHADPLAVTPLLLAFWYASQRRWGWMWLWSIVVMSTKETLPTLTTMLGVWLVWDSKLQIANRKSQIILHPSSFVNGLLLILVSTAWFLTATFGIVAPLARQYFGTDGPIYLAQRYTGGLAGLLPLLQDSARWRYMLGLCAAVGFLPLLAPELLILGLPVLAANLFSNFPGQYSGEQHYSAPLAAVFVIAAIYGVRRLINNISLREKGGQSLKITALQGALLWLLTWSLGYHALHGWTPLSVRTETYRPGPAALRLADFTALIPPDAVVSASAAVHPHLAHRQVIYIFPAVQEADYLLVDITDIPGVHPNDARAEIMDMLNTNWQVVKADYGLLLAKKSPVPPSSPPIPLLPDSFFDFARAQSPPAYPLALAFGDGRLKMVGYDVLDDPDNGVTLRIYWQISGKLPKDLHLWPLVYDDTGHLLSDPTQVPLPAALWYPPVNWRPGETIVTATLPQLLPTAFHLGLAVGSANSFSDPAQRWNVTGPQARLYPGRWAQVATFKRQGSFLTLLPPTPTLQLLTEANVSFGPDIHLTGFQVDPPRPRPGATVSILLEWTTHQSLPADYTVFAHLLAADGTRVAQNDASPTWLFPQPTTQWRPGQLNLDRHDLKLPDALPPGIYTLQLGLYNAQTMERLSLPDGSNAFPLTPINIK